MDYRLFRLLNDLAGHSSVFDSIVRTYANRAALLFPIALVVLWFWPGSDRKRGRTVVVLAALAAVLAFGLNIAASHLIVRSRPFVTHHVHVLMHHGRDNSFPSDHTAAAIAMSAAIWIGRKRIGVMLGGLGVLLGIARVIAGVHYPGDIAGGVLIGIASAALLWTIARKPITAIADFGDRLTDAILRRNASVN